MRGDVDDEERSGGIQVSLVGDQLLGAASVQADLLERAGVGPEFPPCLVGDGTSICC